MPFADKLKLLRQMKNVSQKELSIATNISGASISFYEKGTKSPTIENVVNEGIKKQIIINVPINTEIEENKKYELKEYKEKRSKNANAYLFY